MSNNADFVAKYIRGLTQDKPFQTCVGVVVKPPPELHISIMNGAFMLYPRMLYMNDRLFDDYTRDYKLEGEVTDYKFDNTTQTDGVPQHPPHPISNLAGKGTYSAKGTIINTDTLKKGDLVCVTPTENGQMWVVNFKVRKI